MSPEEPEIERCLDFIYGPLVGSLDMLSREGVGDARARRMMNGGLQSAERAKTLVQCLLAFARRQPL
jgi:hypothetical protein